MKAMITKSIFLLLLLSTTIFSQYEFFGAYDVFANEGRGGGQRKTWCDKSNFYLKSNPEIPKRKMIYTCNFLVNLFYNKETIKYDSDSNAIYIDIRLETHALMTHIGQHNSYFELGDDFTIRYLIDRNECWCIFGNDNYFREMGGIYEKLCVEKSKDFLNIK